MDAGAIVRAGRRRPLAAADAPALDAELDPRACPPALRAPALQPFWRSTAAIFLATGAPARTLLALSLLRVGVGLSTPVLLHAVLERLPDAPDAKPYPLGLLAAAILLGLAGIASGLFTQHFYHQALRARTVVLNAINRRVVEHALRLRRSARARMETGDLVNHLGSDTDAIAEVGFYMPEGVYAVLLMLSAFSTLCFYLGWAALAAAASLVVMTPLTTAVARRYRRLDDRIMAVRDERATLMSQILHGIRVVKYLAWEDSVHGEVATLRGQEIRTRIALVSTDVLSSMIWTGTSTVVAFAGLGTFVWLGGTLDAPLVFTCLALFVMLEEPFGFVPHLLARAQHARVAARRLHAYFEAPERPDDARELTEPDRALPLEADAIRVRYDGAPADALEPATLSIAPGQAVAVVGPVGAGKSTLLRVLAGVQLPSAGAVRYGDDAARPRTAYCPQEAFILNASVRDNVRFGEDATAETDAALAPALSACALEHDLRAMPAGLDTEIGERGVNLSGGQKQRVALARAVLHRPGAVLLDDPLSAVDTRTEDALVERLIFGLWRDITRVVVTHRLAHLPRFDHVVFVSDGRVVAQGAHAELRRSCDAYRRFVAGTAAPDATLAADAPEVSRAAEPAAAVRITDDEDRETGAVRPAVYRAYARAMTSERTPVAVLVGTLLVASTVLVALLPALQRFWFARFTDARVEASPFGAVAVYAALGGVALLGVIVQRFLWLLRGTRAGRVLHERMLEGVLAAPLRFFDATPTGRILARFSRDTEAVDDELVWAVEQCFRALAQTLAAVAIVIAVVPALVLVALPVLGAYYVLQRDYRVAAREAKRLESIARSPRYAHFKELVTGLDVIHGFGRERFFMQTGYDILTHYQRMAWCSIKLNRWFGIRVALVGGVIALSTAIAVALLARAGGLGGGMAGLVLTYALSMWGALNWAVRTFSEVEARMTSAERLQYYASLPREPVTRSEPLPDDVPWPVEGAIELRDVAVRYAPHLPRVLDGVSFRVGGGTKVGLVGRTGAGKSTVFQALFRFIELERGAILVDGVDLASVPLPRLRRAIAIIPQDPTLFAGSVRSNLDRFGNYTDDEVWTALRRVHLDALVRSLPGRLDAEVAEQGHNFSQGQRQLLCMGRAILARARIVVLDEATASVDVRTDELIQQSVREELAGVTVVVIAHRLDTVADADAIVELADGRVVRTSTRPAPATRASEVV